MGHDTKVDARSAVADPMSNVFHFVGVGFWGRSGVDPRIIGRSTGDQVNPGTRLLPNSRRDVVQASRCNGIIRIVSGPLSCHGLDIWGITSVAAIIVPTSLQSVIEFGSREFDAKVGS
jgi:hypothetical protein